MITNKKQWKASKRIIAEVAGPFFDEHGEDGLLHPLLLAMVEGEAPKAVKVMETWSDDHLPCVMLQVDLGEHNYLINLWWYDPEILIAFGCSVNNVDESIKLATKLMEEDE